MAYEVTARCAAERQFSRIAWALATNVSGAGVTRSGVASRTKYWFDLLRSIADQVGVELSLSRSLWEQDLAEGVAGLNQHERILTVIDNLESTEDAEGIIRRLHHLGLMYRHKVIITTRWSMQSPSSTVTEFSVPGLRRPDAIDLIRHLGRGDRDLETVSTEALDPMLAVTEGNPFLIKLVIKHYLATHRSLQMIISELTELREETEGAGASLGYQVREHLYLRSLNELADRFGYASQELMSSFCTKDRGDSFNYLELAAVSGISERGLFDEVLECACRLALIRSSDMNRSYSIHSLLHEFTCRRSQSLCDISMKAWDATSYRDAMQEPIRQSIANAIEWQLAILERSPGQADDPPNADLMLGLLEKAVAWEALLDMQLFLKFVLILLNTMAAEGPGADFRRQQEFIAATNAAIQTFAMHGMPTTDLLLAQASYYANIENNGAGRRLAIQAAITASRNADERLRALLVMSKFLIDSSSYAEARKVLDECSSLAAVADHGSLSLPDILMTRGMSYFYVDYQAAERYFSEAIEVARRSPQAPAVGMAVATAYHYLGRIKAAQRHWDDALSYMVQGRQSADSGRGSEAFYHLRLAEVLLGAGTISEASYHLVQSSKLFAFVQQSSTGQVQLDLVLARLEHLNGNLPRAEELLRNAVATAREHSYPRGELQGLAELLRLQLARASLISAAGTFIRGLIVFFRHEARGGWRHLLTEIRTAAKFVPTLRRPPGSRPIETLVPGPHCRCGADHGQI